MYFTFFDDVRVSFPPPAPVQRHAARGFSLLEVMVVVAIMAVLAALAAPSFTPIIERWRMRDVAEGFQSTLYYARSEAIKRGGNVHIKAASDTDWNSGWSVFHDVNGDDAQDACDNTKTPNECDLKVMAAVPQVTITSSPANTTLNVDRWGAFGGSVTLVLTPKGGDASSASALKLCLSAGGRIQQKKGSLECD